MRGDPRTYRFHWREGREPARIIRWREGVLRPSEAKAVAAGLACAAIGGAVRIAVLALDGSTRRTVTTNAAGIAAWRPGRELPPTCANDWTKQIADQNQRVRRFRDMQEVLRKAQADGLLDARQTRGIAHAFSLALDGAGPFRRQVE